MRFLLWTPAILGAFLLFGIAGCEPAHMEDVSEETAPTTVAPAGNEHGHDHDDHDGHDHAHDAGEPMQEGPDRDSAMAKMMPGLNDLSPADYQSAMDQHICPVSGEMLGTMGTPEKVDVNGTDVWICCDGCKEKLLADPEKYLAKLEK